MFCKQPPTIVHWHKPDTYCTEMARDACKNARLSKRASQLFLYYAGCTSGFKPASAKIREETKIDIKHVPDVRNELVVHGFIGYGGGFNNKIVIDWSRVKAFALLEQPLLYVKGRAAEFFKPVEPVAEKRRSYRKKKAIGELGARYIIRQPRDLSEDEVKLFEYFDGLTEDEYITIVQVFARTVKLDKVIISKASKQFDLRRAGFEFDDKWMKTPEYKKKMAHDVALLKSMPQFIPF